MKKSLLLSFLTIMTVVSFGQRVFNLGKTFSIIPVENWQNFSSQNSLVFAQLNQGQKDNYQENIQINEYPANGLTLTECWESFIIRDFPSAFENYKMLEMWDANINGKQAKWIMFTNTVEGISFQNLVYMLVENNKMYYIICTGEYEYFKQNESDFKKMINNFILLE
jgi:hypothetical protein